MIKKVAPNVVLLIFTYFLPLYSLYLLKEVDISTGTFWFGVLFLGSVLLIYLNNKYRREDLGHKWLWIIFIVIGVLGLLYSGFILSLLFLYSGITF